MKAETKKLQAKNKIKLTACIEWFKRRFPDYTPDRLNKFINAITK